MTDRNKLAGDEFDTRDVLARVLAQPAEAHWLAKALHGAADAIPANTSLPAPQFPLDPRSISLANMLKGGLEAAGGWLDWQRKTRAEDYSPAETLTPLGMSTIVAPLGMMSRGAPRAMERQPPPARITPRRNEGYSLSHNLDDTADGYFHYMIYRDGEPIGDLRGQAKGPALRIGDISVDDGPGSLGIPALRALREHIRSDFPEVNTFQSFPGERNAGVRSEWGGPTKAGADQVVKFKADSSRASLPGTLVNALSEQKPAKPVDFMRDIQSRAIPAGDDLALQWNPAQQWLDIQRGGENVGRTFVAPGNAATGMVDNPNSFILGPKVNPEHQRQGIAHAVYDAMASAGEPHGMRLVPGTIISPEAFALWQKRDPAMLAAALRRENAVLKPEQREWLARQPHGDALRSMIGPVLMAPALVNALSGESSN